MKFSEIIGHREVIKSLKALSQEEKVPHAILFSGIEGIGKFKLARAFAQYLHCRNKINGEPCGECPSCRQNEALNNPDTHFVFPVVKKESKKISNVYLEQWKEMLVNHPFMETKEWNELIKAGNTKPVIYVDESDEILSQASLSSYQENYKIFIIWQPEKLRVEAANKLLKIIEEPFEDTIFLLVSNDESKILPTISSRLRKYHLKPLVGAEIKEYLLQYLPIDEEKAEEFALLSEGSLGKAIAFAGLSTENKEFSDLFKELMRKIWKVDIKALKNLSEDVAAMGREKNLRFLNYLSSIIRENFIMNLGVPSLILMTREEKEFGKNFSKFIKNENIEGFSQVISNAYSDIERNANAKIVMFDLALKMLQLIKK